MVKIFYAQSRGVCSDKIIFYVMGVKKTEVQKQDYESLGHHLGTNLIFPKKIQFEIGC